MLKKRILASSMASVMALSSVSVVAFAEDAKYDGEAFTKEELKAFIDEQADFVKKDLPKYGSKQMTRFSTVFGYAKAIYADSSSDNDDYTTAYQMVDGVKRHLTEYTKEMLQAKIEEVTPYTAENNVYSKYFQDNIYEPAKYNAFVQKLNAAKSRIKSSNNAAIADAYIDLDEATEQLLDSKLPTVTKREYEAALAQYEQMEQRLRLTDGWRRGKITEKPVGTSTTNKPEDISKKGYSVTKDALVDMVYGASNKPVYYFKNNVWTEFKPDTNKMWISAKNFTLDATNTTIRLAVKAKSDEFTKAGGGVQETSHKPIVAAYNTMLNAIAVFESWNEDSEYGVLVSCGYLLDQYHDRLVEKLNAKILTDLQTSGGVGITDAASPSGAKAVFSLLPDTDPNYDPNHPKLVADQSLVIIKEIATNKIYLGAGKVNLANAAAYTPYLFTTTDLATAKMTTDSLDTNLYTTQMVSKGEDFIQYFDYDVPADDTGVTATGDAGRNEKALNDALRLYEAYKAIFDVSPFDSASTSAILFQSTASQEVLADVIKTTLANGEKITDCTGSVREQEIVYRLLAYAIYDNFPELGKSDTTEITREDLDAMNERAFVIAKKTYGTPMFAKYYNELVEKREKAQLYVNEAWTHMDFNSATYKSKLYNPTGFTASDSTNGATIKEVYDNLETIVVKVEGIYEDFLYSYKEIQDDIVKAAEMLDGGIESERLEDALKNCAEALALLDPSKPWTEAGSKDTDNLAFTAAGKFQDLNRLKTSKKASVTETQSVSEKALATAYKALKEAIETPVDAPAVVPGDIDGDGKVELADVQAMIKAQLEGTAVDAKKNPAWDLDADEKFTLKDANIGIEMMKSL